ncbi:hypothetical protein [Streptomyces sp. NRRL S-474]|uniref:hypothetical protein n=1 Tax=Streptomyces sp. NRRL S-474 TaxID=1463909 RepID=UPI0004C491FC|nr:hypothetical protein [Streptomyces sp. NRRL S-474]
MDGLIRLQRGLAPSSRAARRNPAPDLFGDDAAPFTKTFERIRATALSVEDSVARIADMEEGHRK